MQSKDSEKKNTGTSSQNLPEQPSQADPRGSELKLRVADLSLSAFPAMTTRGVRKQQTLGSFNPEPIPPDQRPNRRAIDSKHLTLYGHKPTDCWHGTSSAALSMVARLGLQSQREVRKNGLPLLSGESGHGAPRYGVNKVFVSAFETSGLAQIGSYAKSFVQIRNKSDLKRNIKETKSLLLEWKKGLEANLSKDESDSRIGPEERQSDRQRSQTQLTDNFRKAFRNIKRSAEYLKKLPVSEKGFLAEQFPVVIGVSEPDVKMRGYQILSDLRSEVGIESAGSEHLNIFVPHDKVAEVRAFAQRSNRNANIVSLEDLPLFLSITNSNVKNSCTTIARDLGPHLANQGRDFSELAERLETTQAAYLAGLVRRHGGAAKFQPEEYARQSPYLMAEVRARR